MTSKIKYVLIDERFPRAGVINDDRGFRDNFDVIKQGLKNAGEEVTDLQENIARTDADNDFANNTSRRINLKDFTQEALVGGTIPNSDDPAVPTNIDVSEGSYQAFVVSDDSDLVFMNWPEDNYSCVYIELRPSETVELGLPSPPHVVTFLNNKDAEFKKRPNAVWDNAALATGEFFSPEKLQALVGEAFKGSDSVIEAPKSQDSTIDIPVQVFKFWTYDAGETIYAEYLDEYDVSSTAPEPGESNIIFLDDLFDVDASDPNDGDIIVYNSLTDSWDTSFIDVDVDKLDDILNVDASNPDNGDSIIYNSSTDTWSIGIISDDELLSIAAEPDTFSLTSDSVGVYYRATSENIVELIVPTDDVEFPIGGVVTVIQSGLGKVTVAPNESVTVNSADGYLSTRTQYSAATLIKIASNQWDLIGDLAGAELPFVCCPDWETLGANQYGTSQTILDDEPGPDLSLTELYSIRGDGASIAIRNSQQVFFLDDMRFVSAAFDFNSVSNTPFTSLQATSLCFYLEVASFGSQDPATLDIAFQDDNIVQASAQLNVTQAENNANPNKVYKVEMPLGFNGISTFTMLRFDNNSGSTFYLHNIRVCNNGELGSYVYNSSGGGFGGGGLGPILLP